ncbi:MAG: hypothetical protein HQ513_11100 [Rhodospirillales bacterium]|nr:hypothetical protein [Rhodospirillales bacterium]
MILRTVLSLLGLFLITVSFSASAQDLVVVGGGAPNLHLGQIVKSDAPLDIPAGSTVTLVSESGKTITLKGPHAGPAGIGAEGAGNAGLVASLSGLLSGAGKNTSSLGAMRAIAPPPPPGDPWVIDTGQSGDHCVPANGPVTLWRARNTKTWNMALKNLSNKSKSTTVWPVGTNTLNWPSGVALVDGSRYLLRLKKSRMSRKFTLHLVPGDLPSPAHKVAWMTDKGCRKQAMRLLDRLQ